jgi:hypothetical protein
MQNVQDDALLARQSIANVRNMIESSPHPKNLALAFGKVENRSASYSVFVSLRRRLGQEEKQKIPRGSYDYWILINARGHRTKKNNQYSLVPWP